ERARQRGLIDRLRLRVVLVTAVHVDLGLEAAIELAERGRGRHARPPTWQREWHRGVSSGVECGLRAVEQRGDVREHRRLAPNGVECALTDDDRSPDAVARLD